MVQQIRKAQWLDQWHCRRIIAGMLQGRTTIDTHAHAALAWLVDAGVDTLVGDAPHNWLAAPPVPALAPVVVAPARPAPRTIAADTLAALDAALAEFAHPLRASAGVGPQLTAGAMDAGLVLLVDMPDAPGSAADKLRRAMLAAIGLDGDAFGVVHLLPYPTPGARAPRDGELADFAPYVLQALALARPRFVLAMGDKATAFADNPRANVASARGRWLDCHGIPALATFHPRRLLTQPELKRQAWDDLQMLAERLTETR